MSFQFVQTCCHTFTVSYQRLFWICELQHQINTYLSLDIWKLRLCAINTSKYKSFHKTFLRGEGNQVGKISQTCMSFFFQCMEHKRKSLAQCSGCYFPFNGKMHSFHKGRFGKVQSTIDYFKGPVNDFHSWMNYSSKNYKCNLAIMQL